VVVFRINSFIGTLATGSLLQAAIIAVTNEQNLTSGIDFHFQEIGTASIGDITLPVIYMFAVAIVLWFVLEHTVLGRSAHATGLAEIPARLSGVRTDALKFGSLLVSATIAGFAGILLTAIVGSASPTVGPPYLIPAFAAAFLGATQLRGGLFNAWGTVIAVLLLGTVNVGLSLGNVPLWTPFAFTGVVLILALGLGGLRRRASISA
jgi:ribose transport system permease protein